MHEFWDTSPQALAAVMYLKTISDSVKILLVVAKTRVAPVKSIWRRNLTYIEPFYCLINCVTLKTSQNWWRHTFMDGHYFNIKLDFESTNKRKSICLASVCKDPHINLHKNLVPYTLDIKPCWNVLLRNVLL